MPNFLPPTHTCQLTPSTHRAELLKTIRDAKVFANRDIALFGETLNALPTLLGPSDIPLYPLELWPQPRPSRGILRQMVEILLASSSITLKRPHSTKCHSASDAETSTRKSAKTDAFRKAVEECSTADAQNAIAGKSVKEKTVRTYGPAVQRYIFMCQKKNLTAFPATIETVTLYAGFMKLQSAAYMSPGTDLSAIRNEHRARGFPPLEDDGRIGAAAAALEQGLPEHEQAEPFTLQILQELYARASSEKDVDLILVLLGSIYTLARADAFAQILCEDVEIYLSGARVTQRALKGAKRTRTLPMTFERVPALGSLPNSRFGALPLCPVAVFERLKSRAKQELLSNIGKTSLQRMLDHLLDRAGIHNKVEGRERRRFSPHSTRVAGACFLLRCGLIPSVISAMADWNSNMVEHYGRRLLLDPSFIEPLKFYNPNAMAASYGAIGSGLSAALNA